MVTSDPSIAYPQVLEELRAIVAATVVDEEIDIDVAYSLSRAVVERVRKAWGGQKIYVPVGTAIDVEIRRREIVRRWNGTNTRELCRELGISESRLRQLYEQGRAGPAPAPQGSFKGL
jgi:Mor family transcriptional regulator